MNNSHNERIMSHAKLPEDAKVNNFTIVNKLGRGRYSTVYHAKDDADDSYALKVYRGGSSNSKYFYNEVTNLCKLPPDECENNNIIRYYVAEACINVRENIPMIHPYIVFQKCNDHLGRILRGQSFGRELADNIFEQLMTALAYLHKHDIIHTDVKPENILTNITCDEFDPAQTTLQIYLGDLGSATDSKKLFSRHVGTAPYCAPELLLELDYDSAVDIWAAYATYYEMLTGELLFDLYGECKVDYGSDVSRSGSDSDSDSNVSGGSDGDDEGSCSSSDSIDSASSSSFSPEESYQETYRHLALMEKIVGRPPKAFTKQGRFYYNNRGKLKNNPEIRPLAITDMLMQYDIEAPEIEEFLLKGLTFLPANRITAERYLANI